MKVDVESVVDACIVLTVLVVNVTYVVNPYKGVSLAMRPRHTLATSFPSHDRSINQSIHLSPHKNRADTQLSRPASVTRHFRPLGELTKK